MSVCRASRSEEAGEPNLAPPPEALRGATPQTRKCTAERRRRHQTSWETSLQSSSATLLAAVRGAEAPEAWLPLPPSLAGGGLPSSLHNHRDAQRRTIWQRRYDLQALESRIWAHACPVLHLGLLSAHCLKSLQQSRADPATDRIDYRAFKIAFTSRFWP